MKLDCICFIRNCFAFAKCEAFNGFNLKFAMDSMDDMTGRSNFTYATTHHNVASVIYQNSGIKTEAS